MSDGRAECVIHVNLSQYGVTIKCLIEKTPLGTAGPIGLAREEILRDNSDGFFFVLNSDIVSEYSFEQLLEEHKSNVAEVSLNVKVVEDPSKYGVVVCNDQGHVSEFIQTPKQFKSNKVNTGIYLFNTSIFDLKIIKSSP